MVVRLPFDSGPFDIREIDVMGPRAEISPQFLQRLLEHSCAIQEEQRHNSNRRKRRTEDVKKIDVRFLLDLEVNQ
jgi:hypothetical protein